MEALEHDVVQLRSLYERVRGRVYSPEGSTKGPPEPPTGSREQKDQVLTQFLAGRVKHGS